MSLRTLTPKDHVTNLVLYLIGVGIMPLGVVLTINAHLGSGGIDALNFALADKLGVNTSVAIYITSFITLCIAALIRRSYPRIQTFVTSFFLGLFTDLWNYILQDVQGTEIVSQILILLAGLIISAFSIACYMISIFPTNPNDDLVLALREAGVSISLSKIGFDAVCVVLALLMHGEIWLGTIICTFCLGPVIDLFYKKIDKLPPVLEMKEHYNSDRAK